MVNPVWIANSKIKAKVFGVFVAVLMMKLGVIQAQIYVFITILIIVIIVVHQIQCVTISVGSQKIVVVD